MTSTGLFSVADRYDRLMGPIFFAPTATAVAGHIESVLGVPAPAVLEVAAGTGRLTQALCRALPSARITATDVSRPMLEYAQTRRGLPAVRWMLGDAHDLPFQNADFDLVVSQFGVMFFSDRGRALREAARVLMPGGCYVQTSWDVLRPGDVDEAACRAFAPLSAKAGHMLSDVIHGYHDPAAITDDLMAAGFTDVTVDVLDVPATATAEAAGAALAQGSALAAVFTADGVDLHTATEAAAAEIAHTLGVGGSDQFTTTLRVVVASGRR